MRNIALHSVEKICAFCLKWFGNTYEQRVLWITSNSLIAKYIISISCTGKKA